MDYRALNAMLNLYSSTGGLQLDKDLLALEEYLQKEIQPRTRCFESIESRINTLVAEHYYDPELLKLYSIADITAVFDVAYSCKFKFTSFFGAYKFYTSYALKSFDGAQYLEHFEDRATIVSLYLASGNVELAKQFVQVICRGEFQPATPTFLNAGKVQRGELVSCFLIRMEDNMESIGRGITSALQLSKRGGGVAFCLTNIREQGAPIKKIENQSSGVLPIMKLLEDSFSYANQLGARQGAGAVYLSAHHMDIMKFLDTKRENADEKIRIKSLSVGIVVPDITFELAAKNQDMHLFSSYDIYNVLGTPMSDISISERYQELIEDSRIRKTKINARTFFQTVAELQFESGYPYILFEDNANRANPLQGRINMSNLCTEILQVNNASYYNDDMSYKVVGRDISCNLGSINIARIFERDPTSCEDKLAKIIPVAVTALTAVSDLSSIKCVPSVYHGNRSYHSIGLGQMNLHGCLVKFGMEYGSPEALDFVNMYFYCVAYHCYLTSNNIAKATGKMFYNFANSKYADGSYFHKYLIDSWYPETEVVSQIFATNNIRIPTQRDWQELSESVQLHGLYHSYLQAIAPTGSISYINHSTSSLHPIISKIEIRKEGKLGRAYYPAPYLTDENAHLYKSAYDTPPEKIIDTYAVAGQHIDQGLSCTLFFNMDNNVTTRDINRMQVYAWRKGIKTLYYMRLRQSALQGTNVDECVSCSM